MRSITSKKIRLVTVLVVSFILCGFGLILIPMLPIVQRVSGNMLSAQDLARMIKKKNFYLINIQIPYSGEIKKTDSFMQPDQVVTNSDRLPKDKTMRIVIYDKNGQTSISAVETIRKLGFSHVQYLAGGMDAWEKSGYTILDLSTLENEVAPQEGVDLPVAWGNILPRLVELGVIDVEKFRQATQPTPEELSLLTQNSTKPIHIDRTNSQFIVDVLWALGLAQKSLVYEEGPMGKEYKKDAGNFASTGGWNLAHGDAMQYLNTVDLIPLTAEQQKTTAEIARHVYRPCCGNSTWFPDCNHGMAALAAIELMVSKGIDETTIYRNVLTLNSYWFMESYITAATYFARQGASWDKVDAKTVLGPIYSSSQGAGLTAQKVGPLPYRPQQTGGSCST